MTILLEAPTASSAVGGDTAASAPTRPETPSQRAVRRAEESFALDIADPSRPSHETGSASAAPGLGKTRHQMSVLLDQMAPGGTGQPHRHLRFAIPGTGFYSFDIVTWPGHLAISGDLESFTFTRLPDMFDFFRGLRIDQNTDQAGGRARFVGGPSPEYAAQKVIAAAARRHGDESGLKVFDDEQYAAMVREEITSHDPQQRSSSFLDCLDPQAAYARFAADAESELLCSYDLPGSVESARQRLEDYSFDYLADLDLDKHGKPTRQRLGFHDTHEWDLQVWDHHFLLSLLAIKWGVATYLQAFPERLVREVG